MADPSQRKLIIAIDGPAGAGKSTIASRLARKLGYVNLESGAMYRALALSAIEWDSSFDDEAALLKMAQESSITLERAVGGNRVRLNGKDVSERIRQRDVTEAASRISVHPKVREWMVARQREMGIGGGVVMVGVPGVCVGDTMFPHRYRITNVVPLAPTTLTARRLPERVSAYCTPAPFTTAVL